MTLEEKANAYDEAIKRAKNVFNNCYHEETKTACSEIFPELNKNDDEKIRKWIIEELKDSLNEINLLYSGDYDERDEEDVKRQNRLREAIAYLEKLKEQKSDEWNEEDDAAHTRILGAVAKAFMGVLPTKPSEEDVHWLKSLPERFNLQPKKDWTEKDERIYDTVKGHFNSYKKLAFANGITKEDIVIWLKSLCPSWRPSEENEEPEYYQHFDPDC